MGKKKRRKSSQCRTSLPPVDPHRQAILNSIETQRKLFRPILSEKNPPVKAGQLLDEAIYDLLVNIARFDPERVIEVARVRCLPWSFCPLEGASEAGLTQVEVFALLAIANRSETSRKVFPDASPVSPEKRPTGSPSPAVQSITDSVNSRVDSVNTILQLGQLKALLEIDPEDTLGFIATKIRSSEVWIRNSSYPDRVEVTVRELFSREDVDRELKKDLGYGVDEAFRTLQGCHQIQLDRFNARMIELREVMLNGMQAHPDGLNEDERAYFVKQWWSAWEPPSQQVTVSAREVADYTGLECATVQAILEFFMLDLDGISPHSVIEEFAKGNNPLRVNPVIGGIDGRFMLVHDSHIAIAIREAFEQHFKTTAFWESYQTYRGETLEKRTKESLLRVLPGAFSLHGFKYYVPASEVEEAGPVEDYTKRVEGDHLFVLDDVAIIVEDKAVALASSARSGNVKRLRKDLTQIIRKAIFQARRLRDRIENDKGIRMQGADGVEWVDLSSVREIHAIAVSLEDLTATTTGTAALINAGFIDKDLVAWTVSLHDLDLIVELIDHPSEFLLYLRRRTDPLVTMLYDAADELDLFIYFQRRGLYAEPDPEEMRRKFPYLPAVTAAERRKFKRQEPEYISSLTDQLDDWCSQCVGGKLGNDRDEREGGLVGFEKFFNAKPSMAPSPLQGLLDELRGSRPFGWLSIGATLLSMATDMQKRMAHVPCDLLCNPSDDGRGRSLTMPMPDVRDGGWLLAWMTRPPIRSIDEYSEEMLRYIKAKSYQLGVRRATAFLYDEMTGGLVRVLYASHIGEVTPEMLADLDRLKSAEALSSWPPPKRKNGGRSRSTARKRRRKRQRRRH